MKYYGNMNSSRCLPSSQHSVPSQDGRLIATVHESRLIIRSSTKSIIVQNFALPQDGRTVSSWPFLQWSRRENLPGAKPGEVQPNRQPPGPAASRILLANDVTALVWDTDDSQWHSVVNGGCGNLKLAHVCFGYSADEIMLFSVSGIKVVIWSFATNQALAEIRDPKSPATCYDFRPRTGHLAILTRASGHDTLLLLSPKSYELVRSVNLTTVDAQGIKWSPDGRWLAIWDIPSMGFKVWIHTADGHLYKTYTGGQDADHIGLGIKTLKWSPNSNLLAIGDSNQRAILLPTSFFSPSIIFEHVSRLENDPLTNLWEEQINATAIIRTYFQPTQPTCPPTTTTTDASQHPNNGISAIEWNPISTLFATKNDSHPSTIWIWSPRQQHSPVAVLIHHSPIKKFIWHPSQPYLLLIQCHYLSSGPILYLWSALWDTPNIIKLPALDKQPAGARVEASWLIIDTNDDHGVGVGVGGGGEEAEKALPLSIFVGNNVNYTTVKIGSRNGQLLATPTKIEIRGIGPEDIFDEGTSSVVDL